MLDVSRAVINQSAPYRSVQMTHEQLLELIRLNTPSKNRTPSLWSELSREQPVQAQSGYTLWDALDAFAKQSTDK